LIVVQNRALEFVNTNSSDRMVEMVSRTFALSIKKLPQTLREAVGLAYLLFRVSDCLEDHPGMGAERKVNLLEIWERVLLGREPAGLFVSKISDLDSNDPEVYVAQHAESLIKTLDSMPSELGEFIRARCGRSTLGMARWQRQGPHIDTVDELDDYMHQVAGRVGYLMTDIYTWYYPQLREKKEAMLPISRQVGLGLQTVNVIRGLRKDQDRGWVFFPLELLTSVGINRQQFFEREFEREALQALNLLIQKAQGHLNHGLIYIAAFPFYLYRARMANIWPLCFALKTLAISRDNPEVIRGQVKISRRDVREIMQATSVFGLSDRWLRDYCSRLNEGGLF
jgi:farnesyl-diphosphate farnesyltransferase